MAQTHPLSLTTLPCLGTATAIATQTRCHSGPICQACHMTAVTQVGCMAGTRDQRANLMRRGGDWYNHFQARTRMLGLGITQIARDPAWVALCHGSSPL